MKQILQSLSTGETMLVETPVPRRSSGCVLARTSRTLVSLGTEKMLLEFGRAGWIKRARQQPEKVLQVLQKIKTDGLWTTWEAVSAKLDQPIPLGYCHVGRIVESDEDSIYKVGTRIVSNGPHAEFVAVAENLTCPIPDEVGDEQAAFVVVGAIGLQGIRLLNPTLGERIVVFGLGLIGLMAVQMLRTNGCQVLGIDFDRTKIDLAKRFGAETVHLADGQDPVAVAERWTGGLGVDGVLITASTSGHELVHQAATMCRQRGRIVLVGVAGLHLQRSDFYEKELTFQVSCSYGPGRYDANYERKGLDYPIGFVRWTEQRNFAAVLELMRAGKLDVAPLISHRFNLDQATAAYDVVSRGSALGILLEYASATTNGPLTRTVRLRELPPASGVAGRVTPVIGLIGAGSFATRTLLPILTGQRVRLKSIASATGVSGTHAARRHGFEISTTDVDAVLSDPDINVIFVTTPHDSHASLVASALKAGKHTFVEKPLALGLDELEVVRTAASGQPDLHWMVGFNRRFSPHTRQLHTWLQSLPGPKAIVITINAGPLAAGHWTQDPVVGGGRILGEGCHFIDLARYLAGHRITSHSIRYLGGFDGRLRDSADISLGFEDGSIASIHYLATGHRAFPKERVEVFAGGKVLCCQNFRRTTGWGVKGGRWTWRQDKGHDGGITAFLNSICSGQPQPIPAEEMIEVSRVAIQLATVKSFIETQISNVDPHR